MRHIAARFETVRSVHLAGYDIGQCMGELDRFVKTPGRCRTHDKGQEIERAVHDAELLGLVTPLHHGRYAATRKKAVDRWLPLISSFLLAGGVLPDAACAGPPCDGGLAVTVRPVPGGLMSKWIHDLLSEGRRYAPRRRQLWVVETAPPEGTGPASSVGRLRRLPCAHRGPP
jgi:hypothetical protein